MEPIWGRAGSLKHLVLQPTSFCNISCDYCYLRDRHIAEVMSERVIEAVVREVFSSPLLADEFDILFHAGEPLAAGIEWFKWALTKFESTLPLGKSVTYRLQTNGTLISQAWIDLFTNFSVRISISLDGPREINDQNRKRRNGSGVYDEISRGIDLLKTGGIPFSVISVLTRSSLKHPENLFDYFLKLGLVELCFNIEEIEGIHDKSSIASNAALDECRAFFHTFWNLLEGAGNPFDVREFRQTGELLLHRLKGASISNSLVTPFHYLTISAKGEVATFSPEMLNLSHKTFGNFSIGNILNQSLDKLGSSGRLEGIAEEVSAGVENCRGSCEYFEFCKGGSPSNKMAELGDLKGTETWWCKTSVQLLLDIALSRLSTLPTHEIP